MRGRGTLFRMTIQTHISKMLSHTLLKCYALIHNSETLSHTTETLSYTLLKHLHTILRFCNVLNFFSEMSPIILPRKGFIECLMSIQTLHAAVTRYGPWNRDVGHLLGSLHRCFHNLLYEQEGRRRSADANILLPPITFTGQPGRPRYTITSEQISHCKSSCN